MGTVQRCSDMVGMAVGGDFLGRGDGVPQRAIVVLPAEVIVVEGA